MNLHSTDIISSKIDYNLLGRFNNERHIKGDILPFGYMKRICRTKTKTILPDGRYVR